jgi:hypothetical protein
MPGLAARCQSRRSGPVDAVALAVGELLGISVGVTGVGSALAGSGVIWTGLALGCSAGVAVGPDGVPVLGKTTDEGTAELITLGAAVEVRAAGDGVAEVVVTQPTSKLVSAAPTARRQMFPRTPLNIATQQTQSQDRISRRGTLRARQALEGLVPEVADHA